MTESRRHLGRLPSPARQSTLSSLFSNLKDFLSERPPKMRPGTPSAFDMPRFGGTLGENFGELFRSGARGRVRSGLLVNWEERPGLLRNLADLIAPRRLPPLKTTSKPIPVRDIWTKDTQMPRMQAVSIAVHIGAIALIVLGPLLFPDWLLPPATKASAVDLTPIDTSISPYMPKQPAKLKAGGGGGQHDNAPASKGQPPKFSWTQIARPMVRTPEHPQIAMTPTILGNPDIKMPNLNLPNWGDPQGKTNNDSMGQGRGNGLGNGNGNGLGPGEGWNTGGGLPSAGSGGYGYAECLYCPRADYSDEAMKVKVQGVVELLAVITPDGRVTDVHVAKGLGFGLDEKAIQAVRTWRLRPALGPDGRPAAVREVIEVQFQLF